MAKKITIEQLARMVQAGFADMTKRFGWVDERFDKVEEKLKSHDREFNIIKVRLDNLERGQDKIAERLGVVERNQVSL